MFKGVSMEDNKDLPNTDNHSLYSHKNHYRLEA